MDWITPVAIIGSLLLIGFFAGIEIAFISANQLSIELNRKQGTYSGRIWGAFADKPARFIGTTLVGINIVFVVYGLLVVDMLFPIWHWIEGKLPKNLSESVRYIKLFVETVLSTLIVLFVEFICKAFFRARNNDIMSSGTISYIVQFFYWLFSSFASYLVDISEWILKYIFNVKINPRKDMFSKVDLEHFMQQSASNEEEASNEINKELFENALSLSETRLRECLIPRKEIEALSIDASMQEVKEKFISTKLSKLVVYENNIDNISGYIHQLDLFKHPSSVKEILLPIPTVPESMSATDLMNKFSKEHKTIAWVVDEFGGTAGIVTMEDLLEEIFGDIKDEYDTEEFVEKQLAANEFIFSGRLELDYITERYKLEFPNDEATETLSGYIIKNHQQIPRAKDHIIIGDYEIDILSMSDTRIEMVKLKLIK
ncbi:MAG TPA: hemolysin family protein [Ferruginibacter sp.]|nr:HlyC/CorC family transporter [Ferruginibacter sp.]HNA01767.1 hemolysin family protein [Ferruginibacter sp.]HNA15142.1 hemolysin family protein [Ferruginibacter sp.]HNJ30253.1 hemolysin family protein [Ferruginibacter sp.]HNL65754.1 hemolysin family protein [Ferruginibacter sp.]